MKIRNKAVLIPPEEPYGSLGGRTAFLFMDYKKGIICIILGIGLT